MWTGMEVPQSPSDSSQASSHLFSLQPDPVQLAKSIQLGAEGKRAQELGVTRQSVIKHTLLAKLGGKSHQNKACPSF